MANDYFQFFNANEFNTFKALTDECIEMHGSPVTYLPRTARKTDYLYGEDILSWYTQRFSLTMYLETTDIWEGQGDLYAKFGIVQTDEASFWIEMNRFTDETGIDEPKSGDIIYLPWSHDKQIFEVTKAEPERQFYHLGQTNSWRLSCRKFEYSHEDIRVTSDDPYSPTLVQAEENDDYMNDVNNINNEWEDIKGNDYVEVGDIDSLENDPFGDLR